MTDLDSLIRDTLSAEDADWFEEWDEQSLTEMVVDSFRGKSRWLVILVYVAIAVFVALMIVSVVRFYNAETTQEMVAWATGFVFFCLTVSMLKV